MLLWSVLTLCSFALLEIEWMEGSVYLYSLIHMSLVLDIYSISFFSILVLISSCVLIWSYYYMDTVESYSRFLTILGAFIGSMIMLIFFSNLFLTLLGWDGLGVTSFLLVIYYKNRKCLGSGMITALTNRVGDCLLFCLLGFFLLQGHLITSYLMVVMSITKSAQIPFTAWLPAAMSAPTPVSALVHSSTLVTAGIYVLIRYSFKDIHILIHIGGCTLIYAGLCACVESDFKKVVALSTLSQLGVMMVSLSAQEKSYCFFHLMSHACFKALLFMCVGAFIHSVYGTQDYRTFDRVSSSPTIALFTALSCASLMGFPFTTGFFSKENILVGLYHNTDSLSTCLFLFGIGLTACYSMKMLTCSLIMSSFTGNASWTLGGYSWTLKWPLMILGFMGTFMGRTVASFSSPHTVTLFMTENLVPFVFVVAGVLSGYGLARWWSPFLSSMLLLTPLTQGQARWAVATGVLQKNADNGWIEMCMKSMGVVVYFASSHYVSLIALGLGMFFLLFL